MARFNAELIKGTTELIVLALLDREALHGYGIIKRLRGLSDDRFQMNEGALYPLLHRLVREGKVRGSVEADGGRERKTYRLTPAGRRALEAAGEEWAAYTGFIGGLIRGPEEDA